MTDAVDAIVVGSGPNGLAAAVTLAERGLAVRVYEAASTIGGGCRTAELTLPGFFHDVCAAAHPLAVASPFFRAQQLPVRLLEPEVQYAHPLDDGRAGVVVRSVEETADRLGVDARAYRRLFAPLVEHADAVADAFLRPIRRVPRDIVPVARFGATAVLPASFLARSVFRTDTARALFAGAAAHALLPLDRAPTAGFGLVLGLLAHSAGWPVVEGGSERLVEALAGRLEELGGEVVTGCAIRSLDELPRAAATLLDVSPQQFLSMARLPSFYAQQLRRFRYGPGVFKVDYALSEPVPWTNADCRRAGTLHLGGTLEEIAASERAAVSGRHAEAPYVLVVQHGVVDPSRAPEGRHTLWTYCHVPSGSTVDMTFAIERQIERFAPGFRDIVLARHTRNAVEYESYDANYVGGDINGGAQTLWQTLFRPAVQWAPYDTPLRGVYLCSASTPPGGGVHGMCGHGAAMRALRREFGIRGDGERHDNA